MIQASDRAKFELHLITELKLNNWTNLNAVSPFLCLHALDECHIVYFNTVSPYGTLWLYKNIQIGGNRLTLLKRKARPVAPVKRVEISSERLVRIVSQLAHEKRRVPPMWSRKIRPIVLKQGKEALRMCYNVSKYTVGERTSHMNK